MEEATLSLKVRAVTGGEVRQIEAMRHIEGQVLLVSHSFGIRVRVDRGGHDRCVALPKLVHVLFEIGQLPMTVRSPVAAVDQDDRALSAW